jgi:hypothetical protein
VREEHRLRMFENGVLRNIFGPKRDAETWEWRELCVKLHDACRHEVPELFGVQIKKNCMGRTCGTHGKEMRTRFWFEETGRKVTTCRT